jgi:hypothetical protein
VRARPVRPSRRLRTRVMCRRAREVRDGTVLGTITHGARSSRVRARASTPSSTGYLVTGSIHVMETGWLPRMQACRLYAYRLPAAVFRPHEVGGLPTSQLEAIEQVIVDDLVSRHAAARIELRITPSIWPFWRRVAGSTVEFSGSRLGNSAPHPDRFE